MSIRRCKREVDAAEFHRWQVYDAICGIGENRSDFQAATISMAINRAMGGKAKVSTFLHDYWAPPKKQPQSDKEIAETLVAGFQMMQAHAEETRRRQGNPDGAQIP